MRRFIINVNGKSYDVGVEEVDAAASAPVATPAPAAAPAAPAAQPKAPMPGTILEVRVHVGDTVKEGDVLFVLEAMKLENELAAPCAGTVASVNTAKGTVVNAGDILGVIG